LGTLLVSKTNLTCYCESSWEWIVEKLQHLGINKKLNSRCWQCPKVLLCRSEESLQLRSQKYSVVSQISRPNSSIQNQPVQWGVPPVINSFQESYLSDVRLNPTWVLAANRNKTSPTKERETTLCIKRSNVTKIQACMCIKIKIIIVNNNN